MSDEQKNESEQPEPVPAPLPVSVSGDGTTIEGDVEEFRRDLQVIADYAKDEGLTTFGVPHLEELYRACVMVERLGVGKTAPVAVVVAQRHMSEMLVELREKFSNKKNGLTLSERLAVARICTLIVDKIATCSTTLAELGMPGGKLGRNQKRRSFAPGQSVYNTQINLGAPPRKPEQTNGAGH